MNQSHTAHTDRHDDVGYETRDVGARSIVLLGSALVAVTAGVMLMLWWLFDRLDAKVERADPPVSPLAKDAEPPTGPQLELHLNHHDIKEAAQQQLASYGWVDKPQGIARIPIERAMQFLAERGLPEPSGPVHPPAVSTDEKR